MIEILMRDIKNNETYNLIYFIATFVIVGAFVISSITSHMRKKFSKTYVSEMTDIVKNKEKK